MIVIQSTPWDDAHFGIKTGRISIDDCMSLGDKQTLIKLANAYDLVVIDNIYGNILNDQCLASIPGNYICDVLVKLKLDCTNLQEEIDTYILIGKDKVQEDEILEIAKTAFTYSRFKADPFLDQEKADEVYVEWCRAAFKASNKNFMVYQDAGRVMGYILFHEEQEAIVIELIATNPKVQQKGIGSKLISSLMAYSLQKQITQINLGTQMYNRPALNFYQKNGFTIQSMRPIYHYWPHSINN